MINSGPLSESLCPQSDEPCRSRKSPAFFGVGVINADGNLLFQQVSGLGAAFPLERQRFLVRLQASSVSAFSSLIDNPIALPEPSFG